MYQHSQFSWAYIHYTTHLRARRSILNPIGVSVSVAAISSGLYVFSFFDPRFCADTSSTKPLFTTFFTVSIHIQIKTHSLFSNTLLPTTNRSAARHHGARCTPLPSLSCLSCNKYESICYTAPPAFPRSLAPCRYTMLLSVTLRCCLYYIFPTVSFVCPRQHHRHRRQQW